MEKHLNIVKLHNSMRRKIIKQGHNTLTITLPSEWVKKLNLQPGDEVDLFQKQSSLILNGTERLPHKDAIIDMSDFTVPMLWRFFQSAYRSGSSEIKIIFDKNKKTFEDPYHFYTTQFDYSQLGEKVVSKPIYVAIQSMVDRFIGVEVMDVGENYVIIKEMGELTAKEFENSLRRIFLIILQLFERIIEAIEKDEIGSTNLCKDLHTIDVNIDKFVDYCCRILNKIHTSFSEEDKSLLFSTLFIQELLGDEFKYIGKHLAVSKKSVNDVLPLAEKVKEHFELYYNLFYKFSRDATIKIGENDRKVYSEHFQHKNKTSGESRSIERHLMLISKFTLSLTELRIEMEY